jgi:O-antigen ligase
LAVFVAIMVVFSYSRASIGVLLAFTLFIMGSLAAQRFLQRDRSSRNRMDLLILILVTSGFLGICLVSLRAEKVWQRFAQISNEPIGTTGFRSLARQAAADMLHERWLFGWGAGCFRYGFPLYAQKSPVIYKSENNNLRFFEHAHDDLLEFPIEFGVIGLIPLAIALGFSVWQLIHRRFWQNSVSLCLVLVCTLVACHAWVDFVFQNPAVLFTWCVFLVSAVRWLELDQPGVHRLVVKSSGQDSSRGAGTKKPAGSSEDRAGLASLVCRPQRLSP